MTAGSNTAHAPAHVRGGPLVMLVVLVSGWSAARAVWWDNPFLIPVPGRDRPVLIPHPPTATDIESPSPLEAVAARLNPAFPPPPVRLPRQGAVGFEPTRAFARGIPGRRLGPLGHAPGARAAAEDGRNRTSRETS